MADIKISDLSAISAVAAEDLIAIIDDPSGTPASRKATFTQILAFIDANITALQNIVEDTSPDLGGTLTGSGFDQTGMGTISMTEQAAANADVAGDGQMWVKTATPNQLWFTDDAGTDFQLASLAGTESLSNKTLVAPALGTPASGTLTSCTGLPITGITSSTSAEIATLCSDETGSGKLCFATSPTLITPVLGTPSSGTIDADNVTISNCAIGSEVVTTLTETVEQSIPAGAFVSATTNGAEITTRETTTNVVNYSYAGFDTTTSEIAWIQWTSPPNWNAGTVRFRLDWTNAAGLTTETIDFDLAGVALADNDALDTAVGTAANVTDTWIAQNDRHLTAFSSAITIAGTPVAGELVMFKLSRDVASDNMTGDVDIINLVLEYTVDDIGTT
jgi:hypothetical protein